MLPNILSWLTFIPAIGAVILMLLPIKAKDLPDDHGGHDHAHDEASGEPVAPTAPTPPDPGRRMVHGIALLVASLNFLLSVALFFGFKSDYFSPTTRNMQFMEDYSWIKLGTIGTHAINIHYKMGIDGISLLLILLTTFLMVLCVAFSGNIAQRFKEFMVFLLLLETGMIGVFCALDLVLFYFFWEAMLIPMYFLIGIFGHERRIYAAIKFFLYTFAGSVLMLVAIVLTYVVTGSFDVLALSNHVTGPGLVLSHYNPQALLWMFAAFALAFMIKVPMFPFHTWLPDAHVEAPTAGSVILAGVMLKMGTYGFIRFCIPMFPEQAHQSALLFIILSIIGIIYGSLVAAVQPDAKKLVAYSSVAHLGFVVLGIFTFTPVGLMGALVQNINHGISTPMLFFLVGMLYDRRHTRAINEFGGLKKYTPMLATMLLLATLASIAVPFFNGFVGEFPVLLGTWNSSAAGENSGPYAAAFAATGMILSAVYMLWWYQRLMLGPVTKNVNKHLPDLTRTEWLVLTPLVVMVFWFGLFSNFWTQRMDSAVKVALPIGEQRSESSQPVTTALDEKSLRETGHLRARTPAPPGSAPFKVFGPSGSGGGGGGAPGGPSGGPPGGGTGGSPGGRPGAGNPQRNAPAGATNTASGAANAPQKDPPGGNTGAAITPNRTGETPNATDGTSSGTSAAPKSGGTGTGETKPAPATPANPGASGASKPNQAGGVKPPGRKRAPHRPATTRQRMETRTPHE